MSKHRNGPQVEQMPRWGGKDRTNFYLVHKHRTYNLWRVQKWRKNEWLPCPGCTFYRTWREAYDAAYAVAMKAARDV